MGIPILKKKNPTPRERAQYMIEVFWHGSNNGLLMHGETSQTRSIRLVKKNIKELEEDVRYWQEVLSELETFFED